MEKIGIEHVPPEARHGRTSQLFTLWLASNLTIADYALGFLPVTLGVPLPSMILGLLLGNILGSLFLAAAVTMGPKMGLPQMFISRWSFGRKGNYLFAALNWISTAGWFTVNVILGTFALQTLLPSIPFYIGAALTVIVEVLLAVFGYDIIHTFEKVMSILLGALFTFATLIIFADPRGRRRSGCVRNNARGFLLLRDELVTVWFRLLTLPPRKNVVQVFTPQRLSGSVHRFILA
jgi:NCS1 family nucleobase:cation symporter-1